MRKLMAWFVVMALSGVPTMAQSTAAPAATRLSVKRVVLYKNGVGYFEHSGRIRGKQEVAVQFTTAQLDDVLKSLTVIDSAGGQIAGVSYNSLAPLSRRLSTLRVPLGEETTLADFLRVLRGTRIEARSGTHLAVGRLLSVERREQTRDGEVVSVTEQVALVTDAGEVRTFELTPATSIRIADGEERVTIRKNESALVPILQAHLDAEKVSIWNGDGRARRGVWLTNSSGVTLDGGTFNVLDNDAFAGEGLMSALKPGEKRLLSYAVDPALVVDDLRDTEPERITKLAVLRGVLYRTVENHEKRTYTVRNQDATPRTVIIEHPARNGWKLAEDAKPEESTVSYHRFRLTVAPQSTAKLSVAERSPVSSTLQLASTSDDYIRWLVKQESASAALQKALERVLAQKAQVVILARQLEAEQRREHDIFRDQERLRENLKSLKGSAEEKDLVRRYTREMNEQEDRLRTVRQSLQELEQKRAAAQAEFDRLLESLVVSGD